MDGIFDDNKVASKNISGLIRSLHSGMCSNEPSNIRYPGVPAVDDVLDKIDISGDSFMTEDQWLEAYDFIDDFSN